MSERGDSLGATAAVDTSRAARAANDSPQPTLENARQWDPMTLSSLQVRRLSRDVRRAVKAPDVRIAFAGNVVFEPFPEFVEAHLLCHGLSAHSYAVPFDQVLQHLVDEQSELRGFDPNFLLLHFELAPLLPGMLQQRDERSPESWRVAVTATLEMLASVVHTALEKTRAVVVLTNFVGPDCYELGITDSRSEFGEQEFFATLNTELAKAFRQEPRVQILDLCRLMAWHGRSRARDRRLYYVAKMPWHESFLPVLADELSRHIGAALGRIRKCLVVDLDNTLWSGVLGEDGPEGIAVGPGDPVAEAHWDLQRRILALKKRGILLAICSKNNPADVDEVFRVRSGMPLKLEDFACVQINWESKDAGLRQIAAELNIGTDSLVFLDDNPAEIHLIRSQLPEVECVLLPSDPALRATCLDRVHGLDRALITAEDLARTEQYRQDASRRAQRPGFSDLRDYLRDLHMRVVISRATAGTLARTHQLFSKTNQFNVTTRRYSLPEIERFACDPGCCLLIAQAEDRFGDLGQIAVVLIRDIDTAEATIDSFLMSCRAMGRGIESAILNCVKTLCFSRPQCQALSATYLETARNAPVRELFEQQGFHLVAKDEDRKTYRLDRHASALTECDWIDVKLDFECGEFQNRVAR